jgi:hypothetical protein
LELSVKSVKKIFLLPPLDSPVKGRFYQDFVLYIKKGIRNRALNSTPQSKIAVNF